MAAQQHFQRVTTWRGASGEFLQLAGLVLPAWVSLLFMFPSDWLAIGMGGVVFYLALHYRRSIFEQPWNHLVTMSLIFLHLHLALVCLLFFQVPLVAVIIWSYASITGISWRALKNYSPHSVTMISLSLGFALAQLVWVLNFLPIHYMAQAALVAALAYVALSLVALARREVLTGRTWLEYIGVGGVATVIILGITPWQ
jgi:hypothetical protein